ncbi:hypothetical protein K490DRAFT_60301 [Saccharata proteae CBS 121410]|uniref:Uncharacterized protein n=1 Tax=Saccharata proteae CBS 121410 TaxID=1314787 RepID=A0A9P4LU23_9PEZI|nr:hypothetical protein K490DRAFT_60301 [Saccharata proteae CBS 121410]
MEKTICVEVIEDNLTAIRSLVYNPAAWQKIKAGSPHRPKIPRLEISEDGEASVEQQMHDAADGADGYHKNLARLRPSQVAADAAHDYPNVWEATNATEGYESEPGNNDTRSSKRSGPPTTTASVITAPEGLYSMPQGRHPSPAGNTSGYTISSDEYRNLQEETPYDLARQAFPSIGRRRVNPSPSPFVNPATSLLGPGPAYSRSSADQHLQQTRDGANYPPVPSQPLLPAAESLLETWLTFPDQTWDHERIENSKTSHENQSTHEIDPNIDPHLG